MPRTPPPPQPPQKLWIQKQNSLKPTSGICEVSLRFLSMTNNVEGSSSIVNYLGRILVILKYAVLVEYVVFSLLIFGAPYM